MWRKALLREMTRKSKTQAKFVMYTYVNSFSFYWVFSDVVILLFLVQKERERKREKEKPLKTSINFLYRRKFILQKGNVQPCFQYSFCVCSFSKYLAQSNPKPERHISGEIVWLQPYFGVTCSESCKKLKQSIFLVIYFQNFIRIF